MLASQERTRTWATRPKGLTLLAITGLRSRRRLAVGGEILSKQSDCDIWLWQLGDREQMYIRYPERNFRCPSCGARMPTEQYKGWRPWVCPNCSQEWQFSKMYGCVVQVCCWVLAFIALYEIGFRGWGLFLLTFLVGLPLTILGPPLHRVIPPRLEPYEAPFWALASGGTRGKSILNLSDGQNASGDRQNTEPPDQSEPKTPRTS